MSPKRLHLRMKGVAASPGIAIGQVYILTGNIVKVEQRDIDALQVQAEVEKFKTALELTKNDLTRIQSKAKSKMGKEGDKLFDVYRLLLEDVSIIDETIERIKNEKKNADYIYYSVMIKFQEMLEAATDEYFVGRVADIRDVKQRVIRHIQGEKHSFMLQIDDKAVIVARELTPLDTVQLDRSKVLAFATDVGGKTSHAAIMAQSLQIPSVVGLKNISTMVQTGDTVIVNGKAGEVIINPTDDELTYYHQAQAKIKSLREKLETVVKLPCRTVDGKDIELAANIEFPGDMEAVKRYGARGIGLFRTEYQYLAKAELPTEEEQYKEYYSIAEQMHPDTVIIRTLDIGGDKKPKFIDIPEEDNPFLGLRAIRYCLDNPAVFKSQLRAILRASVLGNIKILLPMISCMDEVMRAKAIINEVKRDLRNEGISFDESIGYGAMIEVPSAAIIADLIAKEVEFLSIGTNDLIQYTLAVDRGNEHISYLYNNYALAVLRLIQKVINAGHEQGVWVGMCGEMAADPKMTMLLVGMGLDELSVTPSILPEIKTIIRSISLKETRHIAEKVFKQTSSRDAEKFITKVTQKRFSDFI
ncbi:phosphoenolpyruvate--protein phosphotransferase [candidate division KSB1 bacterium]|nr:phosphoenolpyruvate--protein phosphotransferase [candidate division KSB1 bacterium]